jgi:methylenetetrahydrofolate--tRNA-(uracil-5-)-methyltransferase
VNKHKLKLFNGVSIIGAGLAGCEAAIQISKKNIPVRIYEMKPIKFTEAHKSPNFSELVCSNSLKSDSLEKAAGILKNEMLSLGSIVLEAALKHRVSAGGALAVDREEFSQYITNKIKNNKFIEVINEEFTTIPSDVDKPLIISSGPLTSTNLSKSIEEFIGVKSLAFYDSISPIVLYDSLDKNHFFRASRYNESEGDYINCPLNKEEYKNFISELIKSEKTEFHSFEKIKYFESCLPIEIMAARGEDTLRFGPMKPVGLTTYLNSPGKLENTLQSKKNKNIFFSGQLTGVEGYTESSAMGIVAGINAARVFKNLKPVQFPLTTAIGTLLDYISKEDKKDLQPMNINLGLFNVEKPKKNIASILNSSKIDISNIIQTIK